MEQQGLTLHPQRIRRSIRRQVVHIGSLGLGRPAYLSSWRSRLPADRTVGTGVE
jgi:hypothetical protein